MSYTFCNDQMMLTRETSTLCGYNLMLKSNFICCLIRITFKETLQVSLENLKEKADEKFKFKRLILTNNDIYQMQEHKGSDKR